MWSRLTASVNITLARSLSPALSQPAGVMPSASNKAMLCTDGGKVSTQKPTWLSLSPPSVLALPAASVKVLLARPTLAVPCKSALGVKVAVRTVPVPLKALMVPPMMFRSALVKVLSGSSLKRRVKVAVSLPCSSTWLAEMATVGAVVSAWARALAATAVCAKVAALPAASVRV